MALRRNQRQTYLLKIKISEVKVATTAPLLCKLRAGNAHEVIICMCIVAEKSIGF